MKRVMSAFILVFLLLITACSPQAEEQEYQRYSTHYLDIFDTVVQVIGYTSSEEEFFEYANDIQGRLWEFHELYDKYKEYEGINNIMTINNNAGIEPVKVEQEIIDLILFSKEWHERTSGRMNIAFGSVIDIWDRSMKQARENPEQTELPSMEKLQTASLHGNIDDIIVDQEAMTVFLVDESMSLDVGAVAKGFATEIVGKEMIEKGFTSGVIVAGGNWKVLGKPQDPDKEHWIVGIQNPDNPQALDETGILERVYIENKAVDTSGNYQRYEIIEGLRVHHIIDPETLMPGKNNRGVTVLAEDAGVAEYLATELFLLPYEQGRDLVDSLDGIEALWVTEDKTVKTTKGMEDIMHR